MRGPVHDDSQRPGSGAPDTDSNLKIEQLLLSGLDHYFRGRYERAIDIWSRVLFLDRSHARARAYIDRARASVAERLRESEELVHTGVEAFERGDVRSARNLLRSAVERGGGRDDALSILERLDRLEAAAGNERKGHVAEVRIPSESTSKSDPPPAPRRVRIGPLVAFGGVLAIIAYLALTGAEWSPWAPNLSGVVQSAPLSVNPIPVPAASELKFERARRLFEEGRSRQALRLLNGISIADPLINESDQLRARIQRKLLAGLPEAQKAP